MGYIKYKVYIMKYFDGHNLASVIEELNSLPKDVLENILKGVTLKENEQVIKDKQTEKEKMQASYRLNKIKQKLDKKEGKRRYIPFFSLFDGTEKEIRLILTTLTKDEMNLLKKKYGEDLTETKPKALTKDEVKTIRYVITRKIKKRLAKYKTGSYILIGLQDLYPNVSYEILKENISKLPKTHKKDFYRHFDYDLNKKELVHKNDEKIFIRETTLEKLNNLLSGTKSKQHSRDYKPLVEMLDDIRIEDETDEELLARAKNSMCVLTEEEQDLFYLKYNKDLKNTENVQSISRDVNGRILHELLYKLKKDMKKNNKKQKVIKCIPLYTRFDELTTIGDILLEIEYLTDEEKNYLKLKYGESYLETTDKYLFDEVFNDKIRCIIEKMKKRINRKRHKNTVISLFTIKRILDLTKTEEYENLKSVIGINPAIAVLAKKYFGDEYSTFDISELTGVDTLYIIDVTKAYLLLEREYNRKLTSDETKLLKRKIGE